MSGDPENNDLDELHQGVGMRNAKRVLSSFTRYNCPHLKRCALAESCRFSFFSPLTIHSYRQRLLLGINKGRFRHLHMEGADSEDEAVRAAIAASLRTPGVQGSRGEVVDLTAESDDEKPCEANTVEIDEGEEDGGDLLKAIEMSLGRRGSPSPVAAKEEKNAAPPLKEESNPGPDIMPSGILGLDRKKQEEERLARLAKKRKATSISPPPVTRESKVGKPESSGINDKSRPANMPPSFGKPELRKNSQQEQNGTGFYSSPESKSNPTLKFPTGVVKKTWARGYPRMNDDIKIEEVLEPSDLKFAVLSSFQWDMEWLFSKLDLTSTKCMLVMQAKDDATVRWRESSFPLVKSS